MAAGDIVRWVSNSNTDWATGANWNPAAPPGSDEVALFSGTGQANVAGADIGASPALRAIITAKAYRGNIGASGSPLQHNITSATNNRARILHLGRGDLYFGTAAGASIQAANIYVNSPNTTTVLSGGTVSTGGIASLFVAGGDVTIATTTQLRFGLYVIGMKADVTLNAADSTERNPLLINVTSGLLTNHRVINSDSDQVIISGGKMVQHGIISDNVRINIQTGGTFDYRPNADISGGTFNPDIFVNGTLDLTNSAHQVVWDDFVIGPLGRVMGDAIQFTAGAGELSIQIDLREQFP